MKPHIRLNKPLAPKTSRSSNLLTVTVPIHATKLACLGLLSLSTLSATAQNITPQASGADSTTITNSPPSAATTPAANVNTAIVPIPRAGKEAAWNGIVTGAISASEKANSEASIQVIFDGDSITAFWTSRAKDIWETYQTKYHAFDFAISGDATQNVLCRLDKGQAKGLHPKLIFLMIGHNNAMNNTPEQICEGVAAIIKKYQEVCPDAVIILQATFPTKEPGSKYRKAIEALDKLLPNLAEPGKVTYIDFGDKFLSPDGTISKDIMPDGTHPVEKGFQIWAAAIQPILDQYFPPSGQ